MDTTNNIKSNDDKRKIAIYARKSKITETGNSIDNQIKICMEYAKESFNASDDDIIIYQDEGKSGYYGDREQFIKMLRDIDNNKIKTVICYKFDRISRKTLDLINVVEYLKKKGIGLVSCTDMIDTNTPQGEMMVSVFAVLAQFERNIIAERIADNMYELSKDGRWLGGTTPTGFRSKKEIIVYPNGKKTSINHLEPIEEELQVVKQIYEQFINFRSVKKVVDWANQNNIKTKNMKKHTRVSVKNILKNPVYAIADEDIFEYFKALDAPVFSEKECFDSIHGLMVYNKTIQKKEPNKNSSLLEPEYIKKLNIRSISDWVIAVGMHKGIIKGKDWINVQKILSENTNKYHRPKERTEALLSGLIFCPYCHENLRVRAQSGRYTGGKLRFVYRCKNKEEEKACNYRDVKGNQLDKYIIDLICSLNDNNSEHYLRLVDNWTSANERNNSLKKKIISIEKEISKINASIENQTQNLRFATDETRDYIFKDINILSRELKSKQQQLEELKKLCDETTQSIENISKAVDLFFSFPKLVDVLSYEDKLTLIRKIIERVYVLFDNDGEDEVHIFLKGTPEEKYQEFFETVNQNIHMCTQGNNSIFNTP